jgi:hypothetical protein
MHFRLDYQEPSRSAGGILIDYDPAARDAGLLNEGTGYLYLHGSDDVTQVQTALLGKLSLLPPGALQWSLGLPKRASVQGFLERCTVAST